MLKIEFSIRYWVNPGPQKKTLSRIYFGGELELKVVIQSYNV